jgi:hypothetical protein
VIAHAFKRLGKPEDVLAGDVFRFDCSSHQPFLLRIG